MAPRILCDRSPSRSNNDDRRTSYPQATRLDWRVRRGRGFGVRSKRVKICCIASLDEAWASTASGASALGLVSSMPSGPGVIPEEQIAEIAGRIPPPIATFLLTSATASEALINQQRRCGTQHPPAVRLRGSPRLPRTAPGVAGRGRGPGNSCDWSGKPRPAREAAEHVHVLLLIHKRGALT